ncbi:hypothetical protein [Sinomonas susongensis]|uniref:hypothetical protein n=1 Tax=Sinomonas susongensis TaxID=1324851 RepID=UPI00110935A9|nr:hypothetical protein [Sinomonas susongensis]
MIDDPLREELHKELRTFRRGAGPLTLQRLSGLDQLTDFVGHGSVEQAFDVLMHLAAVHDDGEDGTIRAFFESSGLNTAGDNLDQRLGECSRKRFVTERTILRRSDRGAVQLSHIIRDGYLYDRPLGNVYAAQIENDTQSLLSVGLGIEVPEGMGYRRPKVFIDNALQDRPFALGESKLRDMLRAYETFDVPLDLSKPDVDEPIATITIHWIMPVWVSWMLGAHFTNPNLFATVSVERKSSAQIDVRRVEFKNKDPYSTAGK